MSQHARHQFAYNSIQIGFMEPSFGDVPTSIVHPVNAFQSGCVESFRTPSDKKESPVSGEFDTA